MSDTYTFALLLVVTAAVVLAAVLANRLTQWLRIPAPALVLAASAVALQVFPDLHTPAEQTVDRLVTVALIFILFDGGMGIGLGRFREAAGALPLRRIGGSFLPPVG